MSKTVSYRPSRTYKDGIGKPVVAKIWDDVLRAYQWDVIFPPCNNFGCWLIEEEARLINKAQDWCSLMNHNQRRRLSGETT